MREKEVHLRKGKPHSARELSTKKPFYRYRFPEPSNIPSELYEDVLVIARRLSRNMKVKKDSFGREKKNVIL